MRLIAIARHERKTIEMIYFSYRSFMLKNIYVTRTIQLKKL